MTSTDTPEPDIDEPLDPVELAADRDAYAAEAQALRAQAAAGHAREIFLNDTINTLRADLAAAQRHETQLADALTRAGLPAPTGASPRLALVA